MSKTFNEMTDDGRAQVEYALSSRLGGVGRDIFAEMEAARRGPPGANPLVGYENGEPVATGEAPFASAEQPPKRKRAARKKSA